MSSNPPQAMLVKDTDTKSLKQRQQAEFYAIDVKESKTKPPTVKDIKTTVQSHGSS